MSSSNTVQLASVRVITEDLPRLVRFYQVLTGATPQYLTDDFVELVTPSATFAVSRPERVAFITTNTPRGGANNSAIVEFLVDDTEAVYQRLVTEFGNDLDVVQPPTTMPWGNLSVLIRLYTPVTPQGQQLQRNRTPRMLPSEA
jgi:predicted enzyme related to lactoylglutathione lyase